MALNVQRQVEPVEEPCGYDKQAQVFRALSHPIRLRILDILARREACVCHLTAILRKRQPYISQQLATLRDAGLVLARREGTLIYYRLADEHLARVIEESKAMLQTWEGGPWTFPTVPEEALENCPCPHCQT